MTKLQPEDEAQKALARERIGWRPVAVAVALGALAAGGGGAAADAYLTGSATEPAPQECVCRCAEGPERSMVGQPGGDG